MALKARRLIIRNAHLIRLLLPCFGVRMEKSVNGFQFSIRTRWRFFPTPGDDGSKALLKIDFRIDFFFARDFFELFEKS